MLGATSTDNAGAFRDQVGRHVTYACPARIPLTSQVWGTDVYTDDSPLCLAAIHAGVLRAGQAGVVTLVVAGQAPSFTASTRNGVASQAYAAYSSVRFETSAVAGEIDWTTTGQGIPPEISTPILVTCSARGSTVARIWGTDVYSEDSSICVAAVHAGVITAASGGEFAVTPLPEQKSFVGSARNGVTSLAYTTPYAAFRVAAPGSGSTPTSGVTNLSINVNVATATVSWSPIAGAQGYFVTRWKLGDPTCCNNSSPPGVPLTTTQWVDTSPLQSAGTYGYRLYATKADGVVAAETTLAWNGVESAVTEGRSSLGTTAGAATGIAAATSAPPPALGGTPEQPPALTDGAASYRVTLTGVMVTAPTKDVFDNTDGAGDEIIAVAVAVPYERGIDETQANGSVLHRAPVLRARTVIRGIEYGDVNALRKDADRIRAGNAAVGGGLVAQNRVPNNFAPGTSRDIPDARLFPLIVWEGVLRPATDAVLIVPSIWERDIARARLDQYEFGWLNGTVTETLTIAETQAMLPNVMVVQSIRHPGGATAFAVPDLAGQVLDRPLGLTLQPLVVEYHDRFVVLTREKLGDLAVGSYQSLAIQYVEPAGDPVLGGDYTLELRIERLQ